MRTLTSQLSSNAPVIFTRPLEIIMLFFIHVACAWRENAWNQ